MGVPKRRVSKQRKRQRRAHWKLESPTLVKCSHCRQLMVPHRVCPHCGFYNARRVIEV